MGHLHGVGGPQGWSLRARAALTSVLLALLFLLVYPTTNWITAQRTDVGTWYFEWERAIPFVPWLIVPYMSIDLFFIVAPFLCIDSIELRTLARRIAFAILAAGACFLLMPLHLAFPRPRADGWLGEIFTAFQGMDQPYNLFPSLHITLRTILASVYARHTRGLLRLAVHVWFSLIGFSTVLTYQHHVMDIVGGFMLAGYCFYFFRERSARLPVVKNVRLGWYYAAGAAFLLALAAARPPWSVLFAWPGTALAIVAAAYWGVGPGIYRKRDGVLPLSTRFALGPVLIGQNLSLLYYRRQCRSWDEVVPHLLIGRTLNSAEADRAIKSGVTAVLDLTAEFSEAAPFRATKYFSLPVLDLTAPTMEQLDQAVEFIAEHTHAGTVYVHCKIGYSRSAAVVCAYLLAVGQAATAEEAVHMLRKARPSIVVRPEVWNALTVFALAGQKRERA